ncbi:MFS transporter [Sedimentimonas flavescens]|uniref:MFS transporter n=1 Tax=Sedimentimonas flavescens TaxID=2851012 RepID=UPI001C4A4D60|nr:MFS transporter [Sedimentimonas flavescens]MBW0157712.1 MFS transporter [Sedimentimonas flavescens]
MSFAAEIRASRATGAALAMLGAYWGGFVPWLPEYKARMGVSDAVLGQILLASAAGGMLAMALAPRVGRWLEARLGGRAMLPLGLLLALAHLLPLTVGGPWGMVVALLGMGAAMSSLDIAANVHISEAEERKGLHLMNLNHALFSLAFAVSAVANGLARRAGVPPEQALPVVALVLAAMALIFLGPRDAVHQASVGEEARPRGGVVPLALIIAGGSVLFAAFVAENSVETWATFHFERNLGAAPGEGAFGPAMFAFMMGVGRLFGQALARVLGSVRLLVLSAGLGVFGALIVALSGILWLSILGVALIGLGAAVVVPSASSLIGHAAPPQARARAISLTWMVGFTGFFIGPVVMGLIAQTVGLFWGFGLIAVLMGSIVLALGPLRQPEARAAQL